MLKRRFSQNLIKDGNILRKMVSLAGITAEDRVVEIGAGQGDLTRAIASSAAGVVAVELDREMMPHLEAVCLAFPNVEILPGDILGVDITSLARGRTVKVMGNIPYGITGPIIFKLIGERRSIEGAYLTVQKEIGERMTANGPGVVRSVVRSSSRCKGYAYQGPRLHPTAEGGQHIPCHAFPG